MRFDEKFEYARGESQMNGGFGELEEGNETVSKFSKVRATVSAEAHHNAGDQGKPEERYIVGHVVKREKS